MEFSGVDGLERADDLELLDASGAEPRDPDGLSVAAAASRVLASRAAMFAAGHAG
ncbi:hypothetical protein [Dietzia sp. PP-33]|uniref:hypothetical protein n=1 Tax=Dietzia sp. PP-33 TaxID=2957500 RepID=UPI0029B76BEC|nr:hypothetical protein [Dietzia sp. PP-33]MDX2358097.1 hypothetical protein [Dietzia sp. PP-33]